MSAFRRGIHTAVQVIVDNFADLIDRRTHAHAPQQMTEVIRAMSLRIGQMTFPTDDPGPSPDDPEVPAEARPTPEVQIAVACLAAEASGLPIRITVSSDGLLVEGHTPTHRSLRKVAWTQLVQSDVPMLSLAVETVIEELRGT